MQNIFKAARDSYEKADKAYSDALKNPETNDKQLAKLKTDRDNKLINTVGNAMYDFMGNSTLKDMWKTFAEGVSDTEEQLGTYAPKTLADAKEAWKNGNKLDTINYFIEAMGDEAIAH